MSLFLRGFVFLALPLAILAAAPSPARAQAAPPRGMAQAAQSRPLPNVDPYYIPTRIEALLATSNLVLVADYYRIDMRFGPNLRIDAVVVEDAESHMRLKGLRVQVRDPGARNRQEGTSFIDIEELVMLSRAVSLMGELAQKWSLDDRQATESAFTTNGGFRLAIRQSVRIPRAFLSTGLIDPVVTSIELTELPTLKLAFDQALAILNSK